MNGKIKLLLAFAAGFIIAVPATYTAIQELIKEGKWHVDKEGNLKTDPKPEEPKESPEETKSEESTEEPAEKTESQEASAEENTSQETTSQEAQTEETESESEVCDELDKNVDEEFVDLIDEIVDEAAAAQESQESEPIAETFEEEHQVDYNFTEIKKIIESSELNLTADEKKMSKHYFGRGKGERDIQKSATQYKIEIEHAKIIANIIKKKARDAHIDGDTILT